MQRVQATGKAAYNYSRSSAANSFIDALLNHGINKDDALLNHGINKDDALEEVRESDIE